MKRQLITGIGMKKKLFPISAIVAILCLTPVLVIWASDPPPPTYTLNLNIDATGDFRGKGNCLQASSGTIVATLPPTYEYSPDTKTIGGVSCTVSYSYNESLASPLILDEEVMVHIHIDGSFRKLNENVPADIIELWISGCTAAPITGEGVQYCVNAGFSDIGTVTKTGPNTWEVYASIPPSEQWAPSLCVNKWDQGSVVDGFCIPLYNFEVVCTGTITK